MGDDTCLQYPEPDLAALVTDIVGAKAITGLSFERLRELDDVLSPVRLSRGVRVYSKAALVRFAAARDAAKTARKAGAR
jgi:hypothetical protein